MLLKPLMGTHTGVLNEPAPKGFWAHTNGAPLSIGGRPLLKVNAKGLASR